MKILSWQGKWNERESKYDDSTLPTLVTSQIRRLKLVILIIWIPAPHTSMQKCACYLVKLILIPKIYNSGSLGENKYSNSCNKTT